MPTFQIQHITSYLYDRPVKESISQVRIFPVEDAFQQVISSELLITGNPLVDVGYDYFGNKVGYFSYLPPHKEMTIDSRFVVHTADHWQPPVNHSTTLDELPVFVEKDIRLIWLSEPEKIESQHIIEQLLFETNIGSKPVFEIATACCNYIFNHFQYLPGITHVETTLDEILGHKSGVCQDFAHILLQMLRTIGIPARYVSGYICPNKSGMRGEGATHAWVELFLPDVGWVGLDPTNNVFAGPYHVRLATGLNFSDCSPVKGSFKGIANQHLTVFVSVGYEDGHVFEHLNDVVQDFEPAEGLEPWQDLLMAQQQQQQ